MVLLGSTDDAYLHETSLAAMLQLGLDATLKRHQETKGSMEPPLAYLAHWLKEHNPRRSSEGAQMLESLLADGQRDAAVVQLQAVQRGRTVRLRGHGGEGDVTSASEAAGTPSFRMGMALLQGERSYMEDRAVAALITPAVAYAAVFDGHVGDAAAEFCASDVHGVKAHLCAALLAAAELRSQSSDALHTAMELARAAGEPSPLSVDAVECALVRAFEQTNSAFLCAAAEDDASGTTACVVLCLGNGVGGGVRLHAASAGDSRAVLHVASTGATEQLTREHKPDDEDEYARIEGAGGSVFDMEDGCGGRVVGADNVSMLQTSRSIGDRCFKATDPPLVPCHPHTHTRMLDGAERHGAFVIVASDGVWDVYDNQRACDVVAAAVAEGADGEAAAAKLCAAALAKGSEDNLSAVVVLL